jgi:acyl-coenzyme A synthetase/AMP-(fatty) acid ligase
MIAARIQKWARERPGKTALVHNDRAWTYAQLAHAIASTCAFLRASGLAGGGGAGAVAVLGPDNLRAWIMILAARALGLTTVSAPTLRQAIALALPDVRYALVSEADAADARGGPSLGPSAQLIVVSDHILAGGEGTDGGGLDDGPQTPLGDHILYTSGTTGSYKKVQVLGRLEDPRNEERARLSGFGLDTVFHALNFGLWTGIGFKSPSAVWYSGGCVVIDQTDWRFENFLKYPITYAQTLPESLRALVDAHPAERLRSSKLLLRVGGGLTPLDLAERAVQRLSNQLVVGFSATELNAVVMNSPFRSSDDLNWLRPVEGRVVEVGGEDGSQLPAGVEGELRIKLTDLDNDRYLGDDVVSAQVFRDGYFYPGDLAVRREDGRVRILGRAVDVINLRGVKQAVGPIEEELRRAIGVDEVCLFSGVGADGADELIVAVRSVAPCEKGDLERQLGGTDLFERVRVEILSDFPRTHTGKTKRAELRRMLLGV